MPKSVIIRTDSETAAYLAELAAAARVSRPAFLRMLAINYGEQQKRDLDLPKERS